jgi:hypothetical protein
MADKTELNTRAGPDLESDDAEAIVADEMVKEEEELKLSELLILASLWMLFGFMG